MMELWATVSARTQNCLPLVLRWANPEQPLPVKELLGPNRPAATVDGSDAPPWLETGPADKPFDFCTHVGRLCDDIVRRCADLGHVRTPNILFAITRARNGRTHGLQARVTPLRFHGGQLLRRHRGNSYQVQRIVSDGQEILYLMTFCLPRFLNQAFDDKFVTLFHELFHIGPEFNGDLRRHAGRYTVHSHSQRHYDQRMAELARAYLAEKPDPALHAFLRLNFAQLCQRHGSVVGVSIPRPKLVRLPAQFA